MGAITPSISLPRAIKVQPYGMVLRTTPDLLFFDPDLFHYDVFERPV